MMFRDIIGVDVRIVVNRYVCCQGAELLNDEADGTCGYHWAESD
jgi:hypothetical protein